MLGRLELLWMLVLGGWMLFSEQHLLIWENGTELAF